MNELRYYAPRPGRQRNDTPMRIYDVSVPISARTPTYPGDPGIDIRQWPSLEQGDPANVTAIYCGAHSGTHVEAKCTDGARRVLFKTRNSAFWNERNGEFHTDYTFLSPLAAKSLVANGTQLVGIDYLSVEQFQSDSFETHRT